MTSPLTAEVERELSAWLQTHLPEPWLSAVERSDAEALRKARASVDSVALVQQLGAAGWTNPDWPVEYGGRGLDRLTSREVAQELRRYGLPRQYNVIGLAMAAPTLMTWGTEEQKLRYLPPLTRYDEQWCQLFSEPGAGSDLAGLATRATRIEGGWRISGQKVWSSMAHEADFGLLLTRTNPDVPKHEGITFFILDMHAPGVEVRPLRQMTGESEFNEVFLADVLVSDDQRVGEVDFGWKVAITTLMSERGALSGTGSVAGSNIGGLAVDSLLDFGRERGAWSDPMLRQRLASALIEARLIRASNSRASETRKTGAGPGAEGSITKLMSAEHNKRVQALVMDVLGGAGLAWPAESAAGQRVRGYLRAQANTIEGGTSEIMRNIIGDRVLGLPREVDSSRSMPWSQIPRSR